MINVNAIELPSTFDVYKNVDGEKVEFLGSVDITYLSQTTVLANCTKLK